MHDTVAYIVLSCWVASAAAFVSHHVRTIRGRRGQVPERNRRVSPRAMMGLLLEAVSLFLVFAWPRKHPQHDPASLYTAAVLAPASLATILAALRHLGRQWRIQAVVTDDHRLVTSGPYAFLRHPVYGALLGMTIATGIVVAGWAGTLISAVVYICGTEIRVRAEDSLLTERFGDEFHEYRRRVKAYIPLFR